MREATTPEGIYEEMLEDQPQVSDEVRDHYKKMRENFEEYISAIQFDTFKWAHSLGLKSAGTSSTSS